MIKSCFCLKVLLGLKLEFEHSVHWQLSRANCELVNLDRLNHECEPFVNQCDKYKSHLSLDF